MSQSAALWQLGTQVATASGIIAQVARGLDDVHAQPLAILQGASPNSVVVALPDDDRQLPEVMKLLHSRFQLDESS